MIDQRWAIIAHLDILAALDGEARCRLVLVDLEAGRHAGALCVQAREWEKRTDVFSIPTDDLCVNVPVMQELAPATAEPQAEEQGVASRTWTLETAATSAEFAAPSPPCEVEQPTPEARLGASGVTDAAAGDALTRRRLLSQTHQAHYGSCNCLSDSTECCVPSCDCHTERRAVLSQRYKALNEDQQREYTRRKTGIDLGDLDAVAALLADCEPFNNVTDAPAPELRMSPTQLRNRFTGDEGGNVSEDEVAGMRKLFDALTPDQCEPISAVVVGARETVGGILLSQRPTRRRWEIYRALITLARFGWDDDCVRACAVRATGDEAALQPGIPLGTVIGMLDVREAEVFAYTAAALERGALTLDFSTGTCRLDELVEAS